MIHILAKKVADKIAAGEVIDRPVSIVKELVENSIDAGADNIIVEIRNGGKTYIRVTDNGCGIEADEAETAFKRHATSKISSETDLDTIATLGFRGEALASICAVSRVELITKTASAKMGRKLIIEGSEVVESIGIGCPDGTTITVRDLFYNVPARQKFLYTDNGEARRITDMVSRIALSYGDVRITLINGSAKVFSTNGKGNIFNNIVNVYGNDIGKDLLPVENSRNGFVIKGFVSSPSASAASRNRQIFCVNGRVISSKLIEKALDEAYREKLFKGRFPIAFLFISIPPEKLDVNIHPTKKEVRFDDEFEVEDFIKKSVINALSVKEALPLVRAENIKNVRERIEKEEQTYNSASEQVNEENTVFKDFKEKSDMFSMGGSQVDIKNILSTMRNQSSIEEEEKQDPKNEIKAVAYQEGYIDITGPKKNMLNFDDLNYIGTIFNTYILAEESEDFYLIDQHAAHERIFYEKLLSQYNSSEKFRQPLLMPMHFNISAHIADSEEDWIAELRRMGYSIELFGSKTYIIREIPAFMALDEAENFLKDIFNELNDKPDLTNKAVLEKIISRSCKSAVKGGDKLKNIEIEALIKDLKNCINPFSCPHGRPTFIRMTKREIERMFKRV